MIAIPNTEIPEDAVNVELAFRDEDGYIVWHMFDLPLIEIVTCKECIHFHYDKPYIIQGIPVLGHEVCDFWGDGCKTNPNGFCSYGERK